MPTGETTISEVGHSGIVGLARVVHNGLRPLLLIDGEQIVGAKQNRVFNASFVIEPGGAVDVPVSCVEQGRWSYAGGGADTGNTFGGRESLRSSPPQGGANFRSSDTTVTARARGSKLRRVSQSLAEGRGYNANQQQVWDDVGDYLKRTGTVSGSQAFEDGFKCRRQQAEEALLELTPSEEQCGLAAIEKSSDGARLLSLDLFGSASLYRRSWKKIPRGLLAEVYTQNDPLSGTAAQAVATTVIAELAAAPYAVTVAPGGGKTLSFETKGTRATGIARMDSLYHLTGTAT